MIDGLKPIGIEDLNSFKEAFAQGKRRGWIHFFPFLFFFAQSKNRELLFCWDSGSLCLFLHKWSANDQTSGTLALYFPPVPMHPQALKNSISLMNDFNKGKNSRIVWIDEHECKGVTEILGDRFTVSFKEEEYLYDPKLYRQMVGAKFAKMRQTFNHLQRLETLTSLPYESKYSDQCLAVLKHWEETQGNKHGSVEDKIYTRRCLAMADRFSAPDLIGKILVVGNEIKSFGFVGKMYDQMGCGFIVKSDHSLPGLNNYMLSQLMQAMESCELVNGASDLGLPGLKLAKQMMRPVGMNKIFNARQATSGIGSVSVVTKNIVGDIAVGEGMSEFLHNELQGLKEVVVADRERYKAALEKSAQSIWMNYFPSLLSINATLTRTILLGEDSGSLCVYLLIHWPRQIRLHLYLPPMPFNQQVLLRCLQRINAFNGDLTGRILWIGETLKNEIEAMGVCTVKECDQEFIYDPKTFLDLNGSKYKILRYHLRRAEKAGKIHGRPFVAGDKGACLRLLEKWRRDMVQKGMKVDGYAANRACIFLFDQCPVEDLQGWVYEIDGQIRGFAFGGHLTGEFGCSFVHATDHDFPSLGYYAHHDFYKSMTKYFAINEAGTGGLEGLKFVKDKLAPVRLESIYRGRQKRVARQVSLSVRKTELISGLKPLSLEDYPLFNHCSIVAGKTAWISFFPFLIGFGKRDGHTLCWELFRGSICLYYLSEKSSKKRLSLYFPPFPLRSTTLAYAMDKVNFFNGDKDGEITWVEEIDREDITRLGYSVRRVDEDIVYTREKFEEILRSFPVEDKIATRPYTEDDEKTCLDLLEKWRSHQHEKGLGNTGYYYKKSCIRNAFKYKDGVLSGAVLLVDGNIQGVCFAGAVNPEYAVIFVSITDPEIAELELYQQAKMIEYFSAKFFISSAIGSDGNGQNRGGQRLFESGQSLYRASQTGRKRTGLSMGEVKDRNTALYILTAKELGLKVDIISASYSYCVISNGKKALHVYHNTTSISDVATRKVTHNKYLSQSLLDKAGIPVPDAEVFEIKDMDKILAYVERNKPIVIKPIKGSNSVGVTVDPRSQEEIRRAIEEVTDDKVMVEKFVRGRDYRILIYKGRIIDVLLWVPPYVVGNGLDSLQALVENKNSYFIANDLHIIQEDFEYLASQGMTMEYVPKRGQQVYLHQLSEPTVGGEAVRIDRKMIHPINIEMFLKTAEVSGLSLAGLDFISQDLMVPYKENGAGINEINSTPHIWPHYFAEQKEDLSAVRAILQGYFVDDRGLDA